jgi:ADP-ribosylglycohydrolase
MPASLDKVQGCLLGLALGDALGAPYEGGIVERGLWKILGKTRRGEMRWTDDTQTTIVVVESFLDTGRIDSDDLARRFAEMLQFVCTCGGDADTIGAMAGAVWGAGKGYSSLPADLLSKLEQRERLLSLATALHQRLVNDPP